MRKTSLSRFSGGKITWLFFSPLRSLYFYGFLLAEFISWFLSRTLRLPCENLSNSVGKQIRRKEGLR